jgi:hypothetical protein
MRNLFLVLWLLVLTSSIQLMAQDKSIITVKGSEVSNGVMTLTAQQAATPDQAAESFVLHCNKGMSDCTAVEAGSYLMVRLPKNWGMYDCTDVDLYPTTADPASSQKLGEYCLSKK